jgi:hypothetical protein
MHIKSCLLTILFFLQKTAVAVAYVKAGSGLLKLNGEQKQQQSLSVLQQPVSPWKLAQNLCPSFCSPMLS